MNRPEEALSLFNKGYNCAQAILAAFAPEGEATREVYLKIGSSFGAGIARTGGVCGAVTGALMAIGMHLGPAEKNHPFRNAKIQKANKKFLDDFSARHGSVTCNPLRGFDKEKTYQKGNRDICPSLVQSAADILDKILKQK